MRVPSNERWLWYALRTSDSVRLDADAYPSILYDGVRVPWPEWACKAPDGGIHVNASRGLIDIQVAKAPNLRDQINWTWDFNVRLARRDWFAGLEDLTGVSNVAVGGLFLGAEKLEDWVTLHQRRAPPLVSKTGMSKCCPLCGNWYSLVRERPFFADSGVREMRLIVNGNGIFVREDEAVRRELRTPVGAFKPARVGLKNPPQPTAPGR